MKNGLSSKQLFDRPINSLMTYYTFNKVDKRQAMTSVLFDKLVGFPSKLLERQLLAMHFK